MKNRVIDDVKVNIKIPQFEGLKKASDALRESLGKILSQQEHFQEQLSKVAEALREFQKRTPNDLSIIAQHGWYIDLEAEINWPNRIAKLIRSGDIDSMNNQLENYYDNNIDSLFNELMNRHSNRSGILAEILNCHKNEMYNVAIPTILCQVDGICNDITKEKFFLKDKDFLPRFLNSLDVRSGSLIELFISPLNKEVPIYAYEKTENSYPCNLNRHSIIHGVDYKYGTKRNSLKCVSLIKYISDILN